MKKKLFTEKQKPKTVVILGYLSMILRVPQSHTEIGLLYASNSQLVTKPLLESINQNKQSAKNKK